jgi:hypothetical protein
MTSGDTGFTDVTGQSAPQDPIVHGSLVAAYLTGTGVVPWSAAEIQARRAAGEGVVGIDQTPGGQLFAQDGTFDGVRASIYDVEAGAGTPASAAAACRSRVALGVKQHTLYVSLDSLPALRAAVAGIPGVVYGVANYAWSLAEAEAYIAANPDVVYVQYGDPQTNPNTDVPGTSVTLAQANADIDVARASWAAQFIPEEGTMASVNIQNNWAVCSKCRSLVYGPEATSYPCAAGGNHQLSPTTASYALPYTQPYPS